MKKFLDLEFKQHPTLPNAKKARMDFDNGYGVSVITGEGTYSGGDFPYELAVLKDGKLNYTSGITDDVLGHLNEEDVTEYMKEIQEFIDNKNKE